MDFEQGGPLRIVAQQVDTVCEGCRVEQAVGEGDVVRGGVEEVGAVGVPLIRPVLMPIERPAGSARALKLSVS